MYFFDEIFLWVKKNWIYVAVLWLLVGIAYSNSLHNELVSDDIFAIKESEKLLASPDYLFQTPRFISRTILYSLAYKLNGISPVIYRLFNIFFHLGVVTLVYAIVPFFSKKKYLPFIVAAFTAVHPVMVESVTWISGGIYAQSAFFLLLAFLLYIRNHHLQSFWQAKARPESNHYLDSGQARVTKFIISSKLIWSIIFFILALSTSEKVIVYPIILGLYEFSFYSLKKEWRKIIPLLVISIFWMTLLIPEISPRLEFFKANRGVAIEFYNPLFQIPNAIGGYLRLLIWPDILSIYHYDLLLSFGNIIINLFLFLIFIAGIIYGFYKNKLIFFWLAFFVVSLGVTLNPFGLSWLVAERYSYLGMIGLYFIAGYLLCILFEKKKSKIIGFFVFSILIVAMSFRTILRNADWKNSETLWTATAKASPNYVASQNNLANIYVLNGEYVKAVEAYQTAIKLNPKYSYSYYNLGYTLRMLKRHNEAIPMLKTAIKLNPNYWQSYEQLGGVYFELGKFGESELYVRRAIELAPNVSMLWAQLGTLELRKGNTENAKVAFEKAIVLDPKNVVAQNELKKLNVSKK